jgi:hypothetical protein
MDMKKRALILALAVLPVLAVGAAVASGVFAGAKDATAQFRDVNAAIEAGYTLRLADVHGIECIAQPGEGAMGVHMVNPSLLDGTIDETKPEVLVYEPRNGHMRLVALEYVIFQSDWTGSGKPMLFGHEFDFVPAENRYGLPAFYALHAWIWKSNPSGILNAWNPRVDCS